MIRSLGSVTSAETVRYLGETRRRVICFDTNIIIYLGNKTLGEEIVGSEPICYASITLIESLGYPDILSAEQQRITELLNTMTEIPLTEPIIKAAVRIRQLRMMSLGDAIVAATALENESELWTANTEDFAHVEGLSVHNPLKPSS